MSREVWYEIVDRHGVAFPAGASLLAAGTAAVWHAERTDAPWLTRLNNTLTRIAGDEEHE